MAEDNKITASATLIVLGYELDPDQITEIFDLAPCQAWRKGENKQFTKNDGTIHIFDSVHEWGGWKLWLSDELRKMPLESQLRHWLQLLDEHSVEVKGLKAQGFTIELNCFIMAEVYTHYMPSELQAHFGELGVDLEVAFFSPLPKSLSKWRRPTRSSRPGKI